MCQGEFPTENDDPKNVSKDAAKTCLMIRNLFAHRPEGETCKLEALNAERNTNDGNAAEDTENNP